MLLDSTQGLKELFEQLNAFILSDNDAGSFAARTTGSPEPYEEFLGGLRVFKTRECHQLLISKDRWLELSATPHDMKRFAQSLLISDDGDHNHWYGKPLSLIIEADEWRASDPS